MKCERCGKKIDIKKDYGKAQQLYISFYELGEEDGGYDQFYLCEECLEQFNNFYGNFVFNTNHMTFDSHKLKNTTNDKPEPPKPRHPEYETIYDFLKQIPRQLNEIIQLLNDLKHTKNGVIYNYGTKKNR